MVLQSCLEIDFFHSFFVIMVQRRNCKTLVRLGSNFINDWTSQLFVRLTVMVDLQEEEDVLVHQVVFVVPPFRVVLIE